jgi:hypothetical protein
MIIPSEAIPFLICIPVWIVGILIPFLFPDWFMNWKRQLEG